MLNDKQERFCREYVIDLNGNQAAIRAGYSEATAQEQSSRLLSNVKVESRIKELQQGIAKRLDITADMVVAELWALGVYNIKDFVKDDNTINKLSDMERDTLRPVVGIKVTEKTSNFVSGDSETTITTDLKLADKRAALVDVGKHIGIFEKDNRQKVAPTNFDNLTDEDLIKLAEMQKKI